MMEAKSELDNAMLMDAAFQIIDASLNTKDLFQETCRLSSKLQEDSVYVSMTDLLSVTCTQMQENKDGLSNKSMLSTPALAQEVIRLAEKIKDNQSLLHQKNIQDHWRMCLSWIKESLKRGVFISNLFTSWISKRGLNLEFLWDLHKIGAYNFETHLTWKLKEPKYRDQLSQTLISLCQIVEEDHENYNFEHHKLILTGVTNLLINKSFSGNQDLKTKDSKMYLAVLDMVLEGIINLQATSSKHHYISPFSNLKNEDLNEQAEKKFSRHALSFCLQHGADFIISEHTPSVAEYKPNDADKFVELFMKQLMERMSPSESLDVLSHCLKCDQINSRTIMAFLAALQSTSEHLSKVLLDYIKTSLNSGLQDSETHQVTAAFYLARACCNLNNVHFQSYRDWYQQTFGEASTSIASSRASFVFLIKCLTQWVPEDNPEYLKTHILRRPFIPARMREVYESYIVLAKTRLDDLKIPVRDIPHQDSTSTTDSNSSKEQQIIAMQKDVDCNVKSFEETGKIPTSIMEASIFRKPYFVGKFLPALLKPRCLPDKPDSRMKLIDELKKSGRIAPAMYTSYKEACEREKQNLLEGVFDVDDDGEEMLMSPIEQLQFRLDQLAKDLYQGEDKKVGELLTLVEERVHALVMIQSKMKGLDQDSIEINLSHPLNSHHEQIITKFLCCLYCGLDSIFKDSNSSKQTNHQAFQRLDNLMAVLMRFPMLKVALIRHILLCLDRKTIPEGASPDCLSLASISIMCRSHRLSLHVTDRDGVVHDWNTLIKACDYFLSCCCEEDITFVLRFYMAYLYYAKHRLDRNNVLLQNSDVIEVSEDHLSESQLFPPFVIKKVTVLCLRCRLLKTNSALPSQTNLSNLHKALKNYVHLLHLDWWKRLLSSHEPSLEDWVGFEMKIDPSREILARRLRLSYFWEFSSKLIQDLGIVSVCTSLFHLLAERKELSSSEGNSYNDFVSLLKGLLLQLPSGITESGSKPLWLLSTATSCKDKTERSKMLSLCLHLHPHLLVSDTKEIVTPNDNTGTQYALKLLDLFAESDLNCGGYFSLDVLIFMTQACDCFHHSSKSKISLLCHPSLFTSIMVHQEFIKQLGIFSSFPENFKSQFEYAISWNDRFTGQDDNSEPMLDDDEDCDIDDWMKASALFGYVISDRLNSSTHIDSIASILSDQVECLPYLWELMTAWCVYNMDNIGVDCPFHFLHQMLLLRHPSIITSSLKLGQSSPNVEFRQHLGLECEMEEIRIYSILRQCSVISVSKIPIDSCNILCDPLISTYATLLEGIESKMKICNQYPVDDLAPISSWLQSLVNSCHTSKLYKIDLNILHTSDPLLYRKIYLKTYKS